MPSQKQRIGSTTGLKADNIIVDGTSRVVGNVSTQLQSESDTTGGDSSSSTNLAESIGVDVTAINSQGELDLSSAANTTLNASRSNKFSRRQRLLEKVQRQATLSQQHVAHGSQVSTQAMTQTSVQMLASAQMLRPSTANGSSEAINNASDIAALEVTSSEQTGTARVQSFDADGIISAESVFSSTADASTTSGTASAVDNFGVVDAVQLGDSTINVGGIQRSVDPLIFRPVPTQ